MDLGDEWFLIRASGIQPLVRVMAEVRDKEQADQLVEAERLIVDGAAP